MTDTIPTTMRAVVHHEFGEPADVLTTEERPARPRRRRGPRPHRPLPHPQPRPVDDPRHLTASSPSCPQPPAPRHSARS